MTRPRTRLDFSESLHSTLPGACRRPRGYRRPRHLAVRRCRLAVLPGRWLSWPELSRRSRNIMPEPEATAVEFSTARAVVRPFSPSDASEVFDCISPEITKLMAWEPPPTMEAFEAVWRGWLPGIESRTNFNFVARERDTSRFLGVLGLHAARSLTPELGIWLRTDAHGIGLGRELVAGVVRWASNAIHIEHFEYPVAEQNLPSRRVAEALGGEVREQRSHPKYRAVVYHIPAWTGDV